MSKIISAFHRNGLDVPGSARKIEAILREIAPDIIRAQARCSVRHAGSHIQGALNLPDHFPRRGLSLCQGKLYSGAETWWVPGGGFPDGSYALVREDDAVLEAVSDPAASRAIWYYFDDEVFVVSNSQRAITMYVGRFAFNPEVVPWVISTGTPGWGNSYNRLLKVLPPASAVSLDKAAWTLRVQEAEARFAPVDRSREAHLAAMTQALEETFAAFTPEDAEASIIALSGGCDSRAIAGFLTRAAPSLEWRSFTGGLAGGLGAPGSDVTVGAEVARRLGTRHEQVVIAPSPEPTATILRRFILASEGGNDHMNHPDGGILNKRLHDAGIAVMLRGDEGFGWKPVAPTALSVRRSMDLLLCSDIANLAPHLKAFGLEGQRLPDRLERRPAESFETWRDRLYFEFRLATLLASMTENKTAYYDVINPLLSRRALEVVRGLPDALRTDKALFRELVRDLGPDLPFATDRDPPRLDFLRRQDVRRLLGASLGSETARRLFGAPLTGWVRAEIDRADALPARALRTIRARLQRHLPRGAAEPAPSVHPLRFAARIHMATTMVDCLEADAAFAAALHGSAGERRSA